MITVGAPGLALSLLIFTIIEPPRKTKSVPPKSLPISTVARFIWQRKQVYLTLFLGSSSGLAGYGASAWYRL